MATVHKASPIGDEIIKDGNISISLPLEGAATIKDTERIMEEDARKIAKVLQNHLPQGTRQKLLIKMLQDTLNVYIGR